MYPHFIFCIPNFTYREVHKKTLSKIPVDTLLFTCKELKESRLCRLTVIFSRSILFEIALSLLFTGHDCLLNPFPNKPWFLTVSSTINPFPNKPWFLCVCSTGLMKTLREKEKLLVMSNFSFSHSVFYLFEELYDIFNKIEIIVCKLFQFGRV